MSIKRTKATLAALCMSTAFSGMALAQSETPYRLSAGDTISFSILYLPELTREVGIGVDGQVFLPMIGSLDAEGQTLLQLRQAVQAKLRREPVRVPVPDGSNSRTLQANDIVIDVAEYRPVYVTGAVADPGEVAYRPGMTVRQAIVRAGGIGLSTEDFDELRVLDIRQRRDDVASEIVARRERIEVLQADLTQVLSGGNDVPSTELSDVSEAWLSARQAQRDGDKKQLEISLTQMFERLDVLEDLRNVTDETVELLNAELTRAADLRERGIGTADAVSDAREDLLTASSRSLSTSNELLRLKSLITETESLLTSSEIEERVDLIEEIEVEMFQIARLEGRLRAVERNLRLVGQPTEGDANTVIVRSFGADSNEAEIVPQGQQLRPGDVLEILLQDVVSEDDAEASNSL